MESSTISQIGFVPNTLQSLNSSCDYHLKWNKVQGFREYMTNQIKQNFYAKHDVKKRKYDKWHTTVFKIIQTTRKKYSAHEK